MLTAIVVDGYGFWLLLGLALLISELFLPGLVAFFFGLGALVVGLLTWLGVIEGLPAQLFAFALISGATLLGLRRHFSRWLQGGVSGRSAADLDDVGLLGSRVLVITAFDNGIGTVKLNGAKWDAESDEPLKPGDAAWVVQHKGIILAVSGQSPALGISSSNRA